MTTLQAKTKSEDSVVNKPRISAAPAVGPRHRETGVTLMELMIVMVIVGILASVAFPSYKAYVDRAKRTEAKTLLMDVSARQERYYFDNNAYAANATLLGYGSNTPKSAEGNYTVVNPIVAGGTGSLTTSYAITVSPVAPHNDPDCGNLSLDSLGVQSSATGNEICWSK